MTLEDKYADFRKKQEARREKEKLKKKAEREKKRIIGYNRYLKKKHKEMEERKKKEEKEKEKIRLKREKEREEKKHKRKPGRPKKRGPKKKRKYISKKKIVKKPRPTIDYKIVFCQNGRQIGYFNAYSNVSDAYSDVNKLLEEDKNIIFPKTVISGGRPAINEILLLEKNRFGDKENPLLRNEFGKLVEQRTNKKNWIVLDKFPHRMEETFWMYGMSPKTERVTFKWIFENVILNRASNSSDIIRVILYLNKIVLKYDDGNIDIVFCKIMSESIKFYNMLMEFSKKNNLKNLFFLGSYSKIGEKRRNLEKELMDKTGWTKEQLQKRKTKKNY